MEEDLTVDRLEEIYRNPDVVIDNSVLKGLDATNWAALKHAYGEASNIPALLRAALSENEDHREFAFELLHSCIVHQGTVYQATSHVVPFFIQMLENEKTPDKASVLILLEAIASGYPSVSKESDWFQDHCLEKGMDFEALVANAAEDVRRAREAVHTELHLILSFVFDPDSRNRYAAINAVCKFPEESDIILPLLYDYFRFEHDEENLGSILYYAATDYLAKVTDPLNEERFKFTCLFEDMASQTNNSPMIRFAAACAATKLAPHVSDRIIQVILNSIAMPDGVDPYSKFIPPDSDFLPTEKHQEICEDITVEKAILSLSYIEKPRYISSLREALRLAHTPDHAHMIVIALLCIAILGEKYFLGYGGYPLVREKKIDYARLSSSGSNGMESREYTVLIPKLDFTTLDETQKSVIREVGSNGKINAINSNILQAFGITDETAKI